MFTKVTLISFIFAMDIFCTGPTRKLEIIGIHVIKLVSVYCTHKGSEMKLVGEWNPTGNWPANTIN